MHFYFIRQYQILQTQYYEQVAQTAAATTIKLRTD